MMGKPAVSVCDWLIPDVTPSRYPSDDYEYVIKTKKADLTKCVQDILHDYEIHSMKAQKYSDTHFANLGHCIPIMMDIIDSYVKGGKLTYHALQPQKRERVPLKKLKFHIIETTKREVYYNYREHSRIIKSLWDIAKSIKKKVK